MPKKAFFGFNHQNILYLFFDKGGFLFSGLNFKLNG